MGLLNSLIEQAKKPKGFIGMTMLKIMNSAHCNITDWGLSKICIGDSDTVLDIGCGGGKTLKTLSNIVKNGTIYGIDYSKDAISMSAKENYQDVLTGKIIVVQAGVTSMPFSNNFFDIITAFQTHYFWPDLKEDMKEVNRILKSGGKFLLASELNKIDYHMKEYKAPEDLRELMLKTGFSDISVFLSKDALCLRATK